MVDMQKQAICEPEDIAKSVADLSKAVSELGAVIVGILADKTKPYRKLHPVENVTKEGFPEGGKSKTRTEIDFIRSHVDDLIGEVLDIAQSIE